MLEDAWTFSVTVTKRPVIQSIALSSNDVSLTWSAIEGGRYRIQYKTDLPDNSWKDLPAEFTAPGPVAAGHDAGVTNLQRFYRIRLP